MPTFVFEAMDATGHEIKDEIEAGTQDEAAQTIRQMGYFPTKIQPKREGGGLLGGGGKKKKAKTFAIGGASGKQKTIFTRQLSILQDAGLPILRSLRILENMQKPGALKNSLMDVCDEIEAGATLSEAMAKSPKVFDRLYINMIRAGEAGGALETILQRLAEFMERAQALKNTIISAMIYPAVVVVFACGILTLIMLFIVPTFDELFQDFELELPPPTLFLISLSRKMAYGWPLVFLVPIALFIFIKLVTRFKAGRMGFNQFVMQIPLIGGLIEKNILARTMRTLGTLVASGVPILEGLTITRETANNAVFERIFSKVIDAIRDGETIAKPMKDWRVPGFHPVTLFFWVMVCSLPFTIVGIVEPSLATITAGLCAFGALIGFAFFFFKMKNKVIDDLVVNMVDVGEETGELDTMLYKVADYYDEEVKTMTAGLMKIIEPLLIIFLGGAVGFIVVALFMPLVSLITNLTNQ
ncbi:MAG: type II secretion system F family protein [bacterium]|nr:type II secretion system F family protein [bacterium]